MPHWMVRRPASESGRGLQRLRARRSTMAFSRKFSRHRNKQVGWADLRQLKIYNHQERQDLEREMRRVQGLDDNGQRVASTASGMDPDLARLLRALKRGLDTA